MSKQELPNHIHQRNAEVFTASWEKFQNFQDRYKDEKPFATIRTEAATLRQNARRVIQGMGEELTSQVEQLSPAEQEIFYTLFAKERDRRISDERRANGYLGWAVRNGLIERAADGTFDVEELSKLEHFQNNPHLLNIIRTRQNFSTQEVAHITSLDDHKEHHKHNHKDYPHEQTNHEPPISRKWQQWTVWGNAGIGAVELLAGGTSNTLSVVADGIHNAGDAGTYWLQTENILNPALAEERQQKRRKLAHWLISAGSLALSAKAGVEITFDQEITPDALDIFAALSSVGLNSVLYYKLRQGLKRNKREGLQTPHEKDLLKHFHYIDMPSAGLALLGAGTQLLGIPFVEKTAAGASGLLGAYAFRPTEANLNHSHCAKHDHGHHHEHETEEVVGFPTNKTPKKKLRTAFAGIATIAVFGGGLAAVKAFNESSEPVATPNHSYAEPNPEQEVKPIEVNKKLALFTETVKIKQNDSQWNIVEDAIKDAGQKSTAHLTNIIVDLTAFENRDSFPNPDSIYSGKKLTVPNDAIIDSIADTLNHPLSPTATVEEKQLAHDLNTLNHQPDISKKELIKKEKKRLQRIKTFLINKLF